MRVWDSPDESEDPGSAGRLRGGPPRGSGGYATDVIPSPSASLRVTHEGVGSPDESRIPAPRDDSAEARRGARVATATAVIPSPSASLGVTHEGAGSSDESRTPAPRDDSSESPPRGSGGYRYRCHSEPFGIARGDT